MTPSRSLLTMASSEDSTIEASCSAARGLLAPADVAGDLRDPDQPAARIAHRRHGQRDLDRAAVAPQTDRLVLVQPLAGAAAGENLQLLVEPVGRDQHRHRPAHRLVGRVAEQPHGAAVPRRDDAVAVLAVDRVVGGFDDGGELLGGALGLAPRRVGAHALDRETEMARERDRDVDLRVGERVRRVKIGHELAEQPAVLGERDEGERRDAFGADGLCQRPGKLGSLDVGETDRRRIARLARPRRMAVDRTPVGVGEIAPGDEAHDAGIVEQQDRGALAAQRPDDRVERRLVHVLQRGGMLEALGEGIERGLLVHAAGEALFCPLAVGDVVLHPHGVEELPLRVAHARRGDRDPRIRPVAAPDALLDAVSVDLARRLPQELGTVAVAVRREGLVEDRASLQLPGREPHQAAQPRVHPQQGAVGVDLGDADAGVLVGGDEPLVLLADELLGAVQRSRLMEAVDGADDRAVLVLHRLDMHHAPDRRAVGTLDQPLDPAHRDPGAQHGRHRRLVAGDRPPAEIELVGSAEALAVVPDKGCAPPQLGRPGIEPEETPIRVAGIDGERQLFQEFRRGMQGRGRPGKAREARLRRGRQIVHAHAGRHLGTRIVFGRARCSGPEGPIPHHRCNAPRGTHWAPEGSTPPIWGWPLSMPSGSFCRRPVAPFVSRAWPNQMRIAMLVR